MSFIEIGHVTHCYDSSTVKALDDVNYSIERGEFFALLGSSGCGKSTLLNIIGGFVDPTAGTITVDGQDILATPAYKRNIGTVFQSYALFPHMTVFDNVAYGLRLKTKDKQAIRQRVEECLALVHLEKYANRRPHQLSGGQQQRVAIARALAPRPEILMLDEPMGNLDAKLRKEMQIELRAIQQRTGITTIMVTHDQEEAMSMADRIGIMRDGKVQQVGTPQEVYNRPANSFVAGFLGKVNVSHAAQLAGGAFASADWEDGEGPVAFPAPTTIGQIGADEPFVIAIRPERIRVSATTQFGWHAVEVKSVVYLGNTARVRAAFAKAGELSFDLDCGRIASLPTVGETLYVTWDDGSALRIKDVQ